MKVLRGLLLSLRYTSSLKLLVEFRQKFPGRCPICSFDDYIRREHLYCLPKHCH